MIREVAGKINPRGQPFQYASRKNGHIDMRRLQLIPIPRYATGLDGRKSAHAMFIRGQPAETVKFLRVAGASRHIILTNIIRMAVTSFGISLPYLNHSVIHGDAFAIEHATGELYVFPLNAGSGKISNRAVCGQAQMEKRPRGLCWNWRQVHITPPRGWRRIHAK